MGAAFLKEARRLRLVGHRVEFGGGEDLAEREAGGEDLGLLQWRILPVLLNVVLHDQLQIKV